MFLKFINDTQFHPLSCINFLWCSGTKAYIWRRSQMS